MESNNISKDSLYLIDSSSFIYRSYYAISELTNSKGFPTNAIFGFTRMLFKIIKEDNPDFCAAIFDSKGPTFRHEQFADYKIQRPPMPDDLVQQLPYIKKIVKAFNIPIFEISGYEADDIIGTICAMAAGKFEVRVVTEDKDAMQLITDDTKIIKEQKERIVYDRNSVLSRYGILPEQFVDFLALMGDKSDNIPGVPGIGEKRAVSLLKEFNNLDNILNNLDKIKQNSVKDKLERYSNQAKLSQKLATIVQDIPIDLKWEDLRVKESDNETLIELFNEFEFSSLIKIMIPPPPKIEKKYEVINTKDGLISLIDQIHNINAFAIDLETTNINPMLAKIVGISISFKANQGFYIPIRHKSLCESLKQLDPEYVFQNLRPILEDSNFKKCGQNIKYDLICLENEAGIKVSGVYFDTMIASYLLNPTKHNHNLEQISLEYCNYNPISYKEVVGTGKNEKRFDQIDIETACKYSCEDADLAFILTDLLKPKLEKEGFLSLMQEIELPLMHVLVNMEQVGILVDKKVLNDMSYEFGKKLDNLTQMAYTLVGESFNLDSPKQLSTILFEKLKLKPVKKTKTGFSTNVDVLMQLANIHELPVLLLEYRQLRKLKSGYVDAIPSLINPKTNRIHTSYNQTITATGRLSSSNPNLQNIPIRTQLGRRIREAFIADEGKIFLSADYSQIELRIMAHISQDPILIQSFNLGEDIHTRTACEIFNISSKEVSKEQRRHAKTINFGIIYGMSAYGLAKDLGVNPRIAQEYIDNYFNRYNGIKTYIENLLIQAREDGFVSTLFNHRRFIQGLNSKNKNVRELSERMAINTPIQGSAADLIKQAMINIDRRLSHELPTSKMILQIHDELLFEIPEDDLEKTATIVRQEMEQALVLSVPICVEINTGKSWADIH